jgi:hypothetical protein
MSKARLHEGAQVGIERLPGRAQDFVDDGGSFTWLGAHFPSASLRVFLAVQLGFFFVLCTLRAFSLQLVFCFITRCATLLEPDWGRHVHDPIRHLVCFLFKLIARLVDR